MASDSLLQPELEPGRTLYQPTAEVIERYADMTPTAIRYTGWLHESVGLQFDTAANVGEIMAHVRTFRVKTAAKAGAAHICETLGVDYRRIGGGFEAAGNMAIHVASIASERMQGRQYDEEGNVVPWSWEI